MRENFPVLLRPSFPVRVERAASRAEGAITDYDLMRNFYARFEEGTVEPVWDDNADPPRRPVKSPVG